MQAATTATALLCWHAADVACLATGLWFAAWIRETTESISATSPIRTEVQPAKLGSGTT